MGIALPQVVTEDRASGAQVIDGSLKFNGGYLTRTPSSNGNRRTWTYSGWIKFDENAAQSEPLLVAGNSSSDFTQIYTYKSAASDIAIASKTSSSDKVEIASNNLLRDTGWYHIVVVFDSTGSGYQTDSTIYINGVEISRNTNTFAGGQNYESWVNSTAEPHYLGYLWNGNTFKGEMSQVYLIDGQALGPESFGYTDLLTNTWRPKKFSDFTTKSIDNWVGDVTGTSYNAASAPISAFDGLTSTQAAAASGTTLTFTPSPAITGITKVRIHAKRDNSASSATITLNGTDISSNWSNGDDKTVEVTVDNLTTLAWSTMANGQWISVRKIEIMVNGTYATLIYGGVNSFYLPMDGNSPIGHDLSKPNPINNEIIWSSGIAGTQDTSSGGGAVAAFDGTTGSSDSNGSYPAAGQTLTWTPSNSSLGTTLPYSSTIRVHVKVDANGDNGGLIVIGANGSQTVDAGGSGQKYVDISAATSPITSIAWSRASSGGQGVGLQQVEVDGVVLVDGIYGNGWTPVNFGGSVALPKATGALPILNTDGGGNVARPGVFGSEENLFYTVTTANGSVYQFDITSGNNPSLSFIRGATYRFDYTSHSSHPLRFSSTNPDSSTSAYTDGTNTSVSNVITITVPHNAPDTLYYYCTAHASGMNGSISVTTDETKADPYAWKNTLALPLVGGSSDVSNSVNSGSTTKTITNNGVNISNANSNFYGGSNYWDGSQSARLIVTYNSEFQFGTGDFCVEFWVNLSTTSGNQYFWDFDTNGGNFQYNGNVLSYSDGVVAGSGPLYSTGITLAVGKWHHLAVTRESSTAKIFVDGVMRATGTTAYNYNQTSVLDIGNGYNNSGYEITGYMQDFRIYKGVAKYTSDFVVPATSPDVLPDTPSGVSGNSKLAKVTDGAVAFDGTGDFLSLASSTDFGLVEGNWTIECYAYIQGLTNTYGRLWYLEGSDAGKIDGVYFSNTHMSMGTTNVWSVGDGTGGEYRRNTWMHVAVCHDSTNMRMYIDGVQALTSSNNFHNSSSKKLTLMSTNNGSYGGLGKGFISNFRILKGTALYTANFTPPSAPLTNVTNTKLLCCQSNTSAIEGAVKPGTITAAGNAVATNFNPFTTDINAVRGQETGYPTWNPLVKSTSTTSDGNLTITTNGGSGYPIELVNTFTPKGRGQWYWEFVLSALSGTNYTLVGMLPSDSPYPQGASYHFAEAEVRGFYVYVGYNGAVQAYSGAATAGSATATIGVGGVVGWAYDAENGTLKCSINGAPQGTQFTNIRTDVGWLFGVTDYDNSATASYTINFGQKPFKYAPPEGFQPLNAANIKPDTVIARSDQFVGATLYTATGSSDITKSDLNYQPDFLWIKPRTSGGSHTLTDSVRGVTQSLKSDSANGQEERTGSNSKVKSFNYNGFTIGTNNDVNNTGDYVAWSWKAGGNKNTFNVDDVGYASAAAAGLTGGSITPTGSSVGTKQGFSILKWTGVTWNGSNPQSISHGLSKAPQFMILKNLERAVDWAVFHEAIGNTTILELNQSGAKESSDSGFWNNTSPTNSVFTVGNGHGYRTGGINEDYVGYIWHDVPGLQKFGQYTANNSADGPFVELGFRPAIIWLKPSTRSGNWTVIDVKRDTFNVTTKRLSLNLDTNETDQTGTTIDILSNGFKCRTDSGDLNNGTNTYIYCAWAEAPTFNLFGGQSNAR